MEIEIDPFEFTELPLETQFQILLSVVYPDLIQFCTTSKAVAEICRTDSFWGMKAKRDFGDRYDLTKEPETGKWLDTYKKYFRKAEMDLIEAAKMWNAFDVEQLLRLGVDPNAQDKNYVTPLHKASIRGYSEIVQLLLDAGADPNAEDIGERTPLEWASTAGHFEIVRMLKNAGAV